MREPGNKSSGKWEGGESRPHPQRGDALAKLQVTSGLRRLHNDLRQEMTHMPLLDDLMEKQGREMEAAGFLRQILEHRFGPLPEWAAERLASLPADRLEA